MRSSLPTSDPAAPAASVDPVQADAERARGAEPPPGLSTIEMAFAPLSNPAAAKSYTWQLAHTHYENFSVVSVLLPRRLRQDFCNVYAFCRIADDLGDEIGDRGESLRLLDRFHEETLALYEGRPRTIVFAALQHTVQAHDIP